MKEEIKEIIDNLIRFRNEDNKFQPEDILTIEDVWLLLDYITNLQEENERLKNGYCELKVKCNNGECDCTNEEYESMVQANIKGSLLLDEYKQRNEKAIEYILEGRYGEEDDYESISLYVPKLLNILKGDKDE